MLFLLNPEGAKITVLLILFLLIAIIQAVYAFTKFPIAAAAVMTIGSWSILAVLAIVIQKDKKRRNG